MNPAAPTAVGSFQRDDNSVPITQLGLSTTSSKTLVASGATAAVPIFTVTGTVMVNSIYGVVTTVLGNNTAAYFRLNDQTAQVDITLSTGTTLTSVAAGSTIVKKGLAATAVALLDNAAGRVSEPTTLETIYFSPFVAMKKTAALTQIEFVYTTSDTPTTGAIQFFCSWIPLSADGTITAV